MQTKEAKGVSIPTSLDLMAVINRLTMADKAYKTAISEIELLHELVETQAKELEALKVDIKGENV